MKALIECERKTVFVWVGDPPKCEAVEGVYIYNQDIKQDELFDPVKGHLWDLNGNNCLVHGVCECKLWSHVELKISLYGPEPEKLKRQLREIEGLLEKLRVGH